MLPVLLPTLAQAQYEWAQRTYHNYFNETEAVAVSGSDIWLVQITRDSVVRGIPLQNELLIPGGTPIAITALTKLNASGAVVSTELIDTSHRFQARRITANKNLLFLSGADTLVDDNQVPGAPDTLPRASVVCWQPGVGRRWRLAMVHGATQPYFPSLSVIINHAVDSLGNVYVLGYFRGICRLSSVVIGASVSSSGFFLAKINSSGQCLWAQQLPDYSFLEFNQKYSRFLAPLVINSQGNPVFTYNYQGSGALNLAGQNIVAQNNVHYLAQFSPQGNLLSFSPIYLTDSAAHYSVMDMVVNSRDQYYLTGRVLTDPSGIFNTFIHRIRENGSPDWSRQFYSVTDNVGSSIAIDNDDYLYVGGSLSGRLNLGNQVLDEPATTPYLAAMDQAGNVMYGASARMDTSTSGYAFFHSIVTNGLPTGVYALGGMYAMTPKNRVAFYFPVQGAGEFRFETQLGSAGILTKLAFPTNRIIPGSISPRTICTGNRFQVDFKAVGTYAAGNKFILQLSDSSGSFYNFKQNIDSLYLDNAATGDTIRARFSLNFPALNLPAGRRHRLRVIATDRPTVGASSEIDFRILNAWAGPDQLLCNRNSATLAADTGFGAGTWTSLNPSAVIANPAASATQISNLAPGRNLFVWSKVFNGCIARDTVAIRVVNGVSGGISHRLTGCPGGQTVASVRYNQVDSVVWSTGQRGTQLTLPVPARVTARIAFSTGCAVTDTFIVEPELPIASQIAGSDTVCPGAGPITYSIVSAASLRQVNWLVSGGQILAGQGSDNIQIRATGSDSVIVRAVPVSLAGCAGDTARFRILVITEPALTANLVGNRSLCSGQSGILEIVSPVAGYSYRWLLDPRLQSNSTTGQALTITGRTSTTTLRAWLKVVARNPAGCEAVVAEDTVTIYAKPSININPVFTTCRGQNLVMGQAPLPGHRYRWSPGLWFSDSLAPQPLFFAQAAGPVPVRVIIINLNTGCTDTAHSVVNVNDLPPAPQLSGTLQLCGTNEPAQLQVTRLSTARSSWMLPRGIVAVSSADSSRLSLTASQPGRYALAVRLVSDKGCPGPWLYDTLEVNEVPAIGPIKVPRWLCPERLNAHRYVAAIQGAASVQWQVTGGDIVAREADSAVAVNWMETEARSIRITARSLAGCEISSAPVFIELDKALAEAASGCRIADYPLTIPNVITANGDGFNNRLIIDKLEYHGPAVLILTNRWGQEVYHSSAYANDFDGGDLPAAVYFYQLTAGDRIYKGWLQVVR